MTTACSACGYAIPVPDEQENSTVECPRCGNVQASPDKDLSPLERLRSAPGRSVPMTIRGKNMLMTAEFDRAAKFFKEALKSDPADAEAYWGLLLANHQCRDDKALIDLGVCIEKDENFAPACRVGSKDEKARFKECAKRSRYACHLRFMDCLFAGAAKSKGGCGEYWIEANEGTIKNIRFEDLHITGESFSLIGSNKQNGQIIDCTVSGVTSESADAGFSGIVNSNKGVVRSCSVTNVSGKMKKFAALVYDNNDGTVAECSVSDIALTVYGSFGGALALNKGSVSDITVSDVELSGTPDDDFKERDVAGICLEQTDKAHIENCSVSRLTVRDINVRSLAGICVTSDGEIKNCRLSEANISAGVAHYFGGIAGEAQGPLSRCSVDGTASVTAINRYPTDETPCPIIGGIAGWLAGDISYSCSTLSFDIKSKIYYDAVRLFAGGISGSISEGINITRTYFSGDIHIECDSADGTSDDTNMPSETDPGDFYHKNFRDFERKCIIGGIYGSVKRDYGKQDGETATITECFTDGSIEFVTAAGYSSASKPHIYTGGLGGIISDVDVEITDSYSAMNINVSLSKEDGNSYGYAYIGGLNPYFGGCAPHLKNCFFAGTISASKIENSHTLTVWGVPYDFLNGYKDINSYFREDCGFNVSFADDFIVPNEQFMSADFIHNTMLWGDDAWQIADGALPMLKDVGYRENGGTGPAEQ